MRVAVGGLHTECSTYNPVLMSESDFRVLRGAALLAHPEFAPLDAASFDWVPLLHARALAGGPVARGIYDAFKAEFLGRLRAALPLDGLYLAMHGAAFVEGMEDAEADWIAASRRVVGPDCPVAAGYDLHGNVSQRIVDQLDMFTAYRTAPHIDVDETRRRIVRMLARCLDSGVRPHVRWTKVPVLLPGERTSTVDEPARGLYGLLPAASAVPGVWDASMMVGYVWADEPRSTAAIVMTGTDAEAMAREGEALARAYWNAREGFTFGTRTGTIAECLDWTEAATTSPAILADAGDNPTGGGVGDRADVLAALLARDATGVLLAGIADAPATEACYGAGVGAKLALRIGATLDAAGSLPVEALAKVAFLLEAAGAERQAVVRIGGVKVVLTARRRPFHNPEDFQILGLDPRTVRLLVVKQGYLSPFLARIAAPGVMALSAGVVDQDVARLPIRRVPRPTFPVRPTFRLAARDARVPARRAHLRTAELRVGRVKSTNTVIQVAPDLGMAT